MAGRAPTGAAAERRLLRLAAFLLEERGPVPREAIYAAFPDDYAGTAAAREKKFTRDKDALLALRPWAARRVAAALPAIVDALANAPDADFVREAPLLAPYRGGDAATCDPSPRTGDSATWSRRSRRLVERSTYQSW